MSTPSSNNTLVGVLGKCRKGPKAPLLALLLQEIGITQTGTSGFGIRGSMANAWITPN
jgi:hypothetical protein